MNSGFLQTLSEKCILRKIIMAKLIPKIHPKEIDNPGERIIATALIEQLPTRLKSS